MSHKNTLLLLIEGAPHHSASTHAGDHHVLSRSSRNKRGVCHHWKRPNDWLGFTPPTLPKTNGWIPKMMGLGKGKGTL